VISAVRLSRRFGSRLVVKDVSFEVAPSEIVALLGPNGAGKTTTLRMLAGLIAATSGTVTLGGVPLRRATASALRGRIGFLTETPGLWDRLTVQENLEVYAGLHDLSDPGRRIGRLLEQLALGPQADVRAAELSKGMRQKVALARALLHDPRILLLDEPTSGLDPEVRRSVRLLLDDRRSAGCAILISTHQLDEAERLADRVAVLDGRLLAIDTPTRLRRLLSTGRIVVRVVGDTAVAAEIGRRWDRAVTLDGPTITVTLPEPERDTPELVRALIDAGVDVLEVRPEMPALEDVYLHLVKDGGTGGSPSRASTGPTHEVRQ
jgi:ABC-2 type transport system ATP-binding protein